ncbi:MAG: MBL fold metallo-hydrolase [Bacteroidales bacterium]|nr:MBL fold metallo-hydrolase [Bacteroidales bacterium]
MLRVKQFAFSMFGVNTYVVIDQATKEAAVIDPAMADPAEQKRFDDFIKESGAKITQIINTHLHLDHCFGENYVKDKYGVPVAANVDDAPLGESMALQYSKFGLKGDGANVHIDVPIKDGDIIHIGDSELKVITTPGHTPGGICLYSPDGKILLSGDTLFRGSVGRTDLEGGNHRDLINSIRHKLYALPDDVTVLPGHDAHTTIGWEKRNNPYT